MIRKIVSYFFFGFLILALVLYVNYGIRGPLNFGEGFRAILSGAMERFKSIHIEIPAIPSIPVVGGGDDIFSALSTIVNFLSSIVNAGTSIINAFIQIVTFLVCVLTTVASFAGFGFSPLPAPLVL